MAREQAARSDEGQGRGARDTGVPTGSEFLTRAEARALSRCAPLTPAEFKAHGRVAEQSVDPLRTVLTRFPSASRDGGPDQP